MLMSQALSGSCSAAVLLRAIVPVVSRFWLEFGLLHRQVVLPRGLVHRPTHFDADWEQAPWGQAKLDTFRRPKVQSLHLPCIYELGCVSCIALAVCPEGPPNYLNSVLPEEL